MPPSCDQKQNLTKECRRSSPGASADVSDAKSRINGKEDPFELQNQYAKLTSISRAAVFVTIIIAIVCRNAIQMYMDRLWFYVRDEVWFQSAFFETFYVTVVYSLLIIFYPFLIHFIPFLRRFKVSGEVTYVHQTLVFIAKELLFHITPLLIADMLIIKRYTNVPYSEIAERKRNWIVTTRPLPEESPNVLILCLHVIGSVFLFDLFFTIIHYAMHRSAFLYKHFHSQHHTHEIVNAHVTNQLSIVERGLQVISANYALKTFGSHPVTRLAFVPVFLWLLIENHTGYDLPWGPHRILPKGMMGGPAKHYRHHTQGHGNYQPFFTYLDNWLENRKKAHH